MADWKYTFIRAGRTANQPGGFDDSCLSYKWKLKSEKLGQLTTKKAQIQEKYVGNT
jgi:hypothetical protein